MSLIKVENLRKEFKVRKQVEKTSILHDLFHREYEMKNAVDKISFEIEKGEIVGYIGPNGAGKSTLANVLMGHPKYTISEGTMEFNGENINLLKAGV